MLRALSVDSTVQSSWVRLTNEDEIVYPQYEGPVNRAASRCRLSKFCALRITSALQGESME